MAQSVSLESVGGVLVGGLETLSPDNRRAVEDSLLLAWRAALKMASDGPVNTGAMTEILSKIGWAIQSSGSQSTTTGLTGIAQALEGDIPGLPATAIARGGPAVAAWLGVQHGPPVLALVSASHDAPVISLVQFTVALPPKNVLWFSPDPQATLKVSTSDLMLDLSVYAQVATSIADKVHPYLDEIVH